MSEYDHTQTGTAPIVVASLGVSLAVAIAVPAFSGNQPGAGALWLPFVLILLLGGGIMVVFTRLRVRIDGDHLRWTFGFGWPKFSMPLSEITAARIVTNSWAYGYGIRIIPKGMLYNVSGKRAVEVVRRDNRIVRIGSDEPEALLAAIEPCISKGQHG